MTSSTRGAAAAAAAALKEKGKNPADRAPSGRTGQLSTGSHALLPAGNDAEEQSPLRSQEHQPSGRDGDRGDALFRSGGQAPAPQPPTGTALAPAPTPAASSGLVTVPAEFADSAEAYEVGFVEGSTGAKSFGEVWDANSQFNYNRRALLNGFLTGRNHSPPQPFGSAPRGSLDGLVTPAVRATPPKRV
jgi:hypothetical protein